MSQIEYVADNQKASDTFSQTAQRNGFGKLVLLLNNRLCAVTIGPDYHYFIPTFSLCLIVGIIMSQMVYSTSQNVYYRIITLIICLGQPAAYLVVALSNPGIVSYSIIDPHSDETQLNDTIESIQMSSTVIPKKQRKHKKKYCKKCQINVKPTTFHCNDCGLCIEQYDHHCPWVSKCIGKQNLIKFYIFLSLTPVYIIFVFVSFFICATLNLATRAHAGTQ